MATLGGKQQIVTFKAEEALVEAMEDIPNRSEFIRSAILAALREAQHQNEGYLTRELMDAVDELFDADEHVHAAERRLRLELLEILATGEAAPAPPETQEPPPEGFAAAWDKAAAQLRSPRSATAKTGRWLEGTDARTASVSSTPRSPRRSAGSKRSLSISLTWPGSQRDSPSGKPQYAISTCSPSALHRSTGTSASRMRSSAMVSMPPVPQQGS